MRMATFAELYLGKTAVELFKPAVPEVGYHVTPDRPGKVVRPADRELVEAAIAQGVAFEDLGPLQHHVTQTTKPARDTAGRFSPAVEHGDDNHDEAQGPDPFETLRQRATAAALGSLPPVEEDTDVEDA